MDNNILAQLPVPQEDGSALWVPVECIAIKPYSTHPDDSHLFITLRAWKEGEWVTHLFNLRSGGFSNGYYYSDFGAALENFGSRQH